LNKQAIVIYFTNLLLVFRLTSQQTLMKRPEEQVIKNTCPYWRKTLSLARRCLMKNQNIYHRYMQV